MLKKWIKKTLDRLYESTLVWLFKQFTKLAVTTLFSSTQYQNWTKDYTTVIKYRRYWLPVSALSEICVFIRAMIHTHIHAVEHKRCRCWIWFLCKYLVFKRWKTSHDIVHITCLNSHDGIHELRYLRYSLYKDKIFRMMEVGLNRHL